mmetsp:Transcript_18614/g.63433  ORF Transcript_18614/g.63433 Transcript_18614/m.63433 type:complete len:298 (-) Transcript_18614:84-977(-)
MGSKLRQRDTVRRRALGLMAAACAVLFVAGGGGFWGRVGRPPARQGGDGPQPSVEVLLSTFRRDAQGRTAAAHYSKCACVETVTVLWGDVSRPVAWHLYSSLTKARVHVASSPSLNARFDPDAPLGSSDLLFSVDDDLLVGCSHLASAARIAFHDPTARMVGFHPRLAHAPALAPLGRYGGWITVELFRRYNIVLTKGAFVRPEWLALYWEGAMAPARAMVDELHNCEDISMSFAVGNVTGQGPLWVAGAELVELGGKGISSDSNHGQMRDLCVRRLRAMFGGFPPSAPAAEAAYPS